MEHNLIVRFKKGEDIDELYEQISDLFAGVTQIEGVHKADVFLASSPLRGSFDMLIRIDADEEGLERFYDSEICRRWKEEYGNKIRKITVFNK